MIKFNSHNSRSYSDRTPYILKRGYIMYDIDFAECKFQIRKLDGFQYCIGAHHRDFWSLWHHPPRSISSQFPQLFYSIPILIFIAPDRLSLVESFQINPV